MTMGLYGSTKPRRTLSMGASEGITRNRSGTTDEPPVPPSKETESFHVDSPSRTDMRQELSRRRLRPFP